LVGLALGKVNLTDKVIKLTDTSVIKWGAVVSTFIDFIIVAAVVYFGVTMLKLDKLDTKKEK